MRPVSLVTTGAWVLSHLLQAYIDEPLPSACYLMSVATIPSHDTNLIGKWPRFPNPVILLMAHDFLGILLVQIYGHLKSQDYISHYDDKAVIKRWHV